MNSQKPPVLVHVGYIKTGTTYLQKRILSQPGSDLALAAGEMTRAQTVQNILLADDYSFDPNEIQKRMEAISSPVRSLGKIPVWSEESLLGDPPTRRYDGFSNARKLHAVFPDALILITIRRQQSIALSMYREYVLGEGKLPITSFIGTGDEALSFTPILRPEFLCYDRAIHHYKMLFGPDRVLVLPQEMLAQDPADYVKTLADFTGCKVPSVSSSGREHVGEKLPALALRRFSNRLVAHDSMKPGRHGLSKVSDRIVRLVNRLTPKNLDASFKRRYEHIVEQRYDGFFRTSNQQTEKLTSLDLERYGYDT